MTASWMPIKMRAVHWLRARQEERELAYWLSLVSYDHGDVSFSNRLYLVYLIAFFSVWIFAMLTFFASGGAMILRAIDSDNPVRAAIFVEILVLLAWNGFLLWQATRRSPVAFSEQDAVLICQTPVSRRFIVTRWLLMPWLKSAIPLWLVTITVGFSLAEITLPGQMAANRILSYAGYGLRAWIAILPFQLALFLLQWIVGTYRLQKDFDRRWIAWPVMAAAISLSIYLLWSFTASGAASVFSANQVKILALPFLTGFGTGSLFPPILLGGILAVALLGILCLVSGTFSLSRAAQETQGLDVLNMALRYGFTSYATDLQTQQRLGISRGPSRLPAPAGAGILFWKDILQSRRTLRMGTVFNWLTLFAFMASIPFLPDLGSRFFALIFWVIQVGKISVVRLRSDLSCWPLVRQLPIKRRIFLLNDLSMAALLVMVVSLAGLALAAIITHSQISELAALIPGVVAASAGMAAFDVIRRSRSNMLLNGSVPEVSAIGIFLGAAATAVPVFIEILWPGVIGVVLSIIMSLLMGWGTLNLAAHFYRNIDES